MPFQRQVVVKPFRPAGFACALQRRNVCAVLRRLSRPIAAAVLAALAACATASSSSKPEVAHVDGAPPWVSRGTARVVEAAGCVFYGVGVSGLRNVAIRRQDAVEKARGEIARDVERLKHRIDNSYYAGPGTTSAAAGPEVSDDDEQHIVGSLRVYRQLQLDGIEEVDKWVANDGTEYFLCRLTLARLLLNIDGDKEMSSREKARWHDNATKAFADE
jgi:hypothetical protein